MRWRHRCAARAGFGKYQWTPILGASRAAWLCHRPRTIPRQRPYATLYSGRKARRYWVATGSRPQKSNGGCCARTSRSDTEAAQGTNHPTALRLFVFCLEPAISCPAHALRLWVELVIIKCAATPTETFPQPIRLIERTLIRWLPRRGVHQTVTLPAAEIPPT